MPLPFPKDLLSPEALSCKINQTLASDSANQAYLRSLGEVRLKIASELPDVVVDASISDGQVELNKPHSEDGTDADPDILISGKALDLIKLLLSPMDNPAALRKANIRVEGDVALLLELSQILGKIDIDWEALLAEKIGEYPAVILSRGFQQAKSLSTELFNAGTANLEDWLKGPNSGLPSREEYDAMKIRLRELQYGIDRVDALIKQSRAELNQS